MKVSLPCAGSDRVLRIEQRCTSEWHLAHRVIRFSSADFDARHRVAISAVWSVPYAKNTHGFFRQVFDGWEFSPIITARTGNPFTVFDSFNNVGDTVAARYLAPAGATIPFSGSTANSTITGPNTYKYLTLPGSSAYIDPLVGSGEVPTCNMVTNAAGKFGLDGSELLMACEYDGSQLVSRTWVL